MSDRTTDDTVVAAISAGWTVFELHQLAAGVDAADAEGAKVDPLPVVGQLTKREAAVLAIDRLQTWLTGPFGSLPPPEGLIHELRRAWAHEGSVAARVERTRRLHLHFLMTLTIVDGRYGAAYSLGLSLAETSVEAPDLATLQARFTKSRLSRLHAWLNQLASCLPAANIKAVAAGVDHWSAWLQAEGKARWPEGRAEICRALADQGDHWRDLLTSSTDPTRFLTPEAYVEAGEQALQRAGHIALRIIVHFWWLLIVLAVAVAAVVVVAFTSTHGVARIWSTGISLLAGIGVSGASIRSSARSMATKAGQSLLEMEQTDAIGWATTWLPAIPATSSSRRALRKAGVAPPSVGITPGG